MTGSDIKAVRGDRTPTHPGALLRDTVLPALDIPVGTLARHLGVTRQQVHRVMAGDSGVSPEMAIRLGKLCGNGPELWLGMQNAFDLWQSRRRLGAEIDRIPTLPAVNQEQREPTGAGSRSS